MKEKAVNFKNAFRDSDWRVKLSAVLMGAGQFLYGCRIKGILFLLVEVGMIYYVAARGIGDLIGFFTLGTQKADPWLGVAGDNSVIMLLMGIFAWIVLFSFFYLYRLNLKDAYRIQKQVEQGKKPDTFKKEIIRLFDRKFYVFVLALPVIGVCIFNVLPIIFMILIAFTNYGGSVVPP